MAITTVNQAIAGARPPYRYNKVGATMEAAGVMHSLFYSSGTPGAAVAPSPGIAGAALTTYAGQIPFQNPASGATHLFRFSAKATQAGTCELNDRLWHNSGINITTTTAQTVNSVQWPARCVPASPGAPDALGGFIQIALEASAAIGGGAVTNTTISYTNQAGTSGRTGTMASWPATAAAGTWVPFQLQAGDTGVRSVESITLGTSYVSGTVHLVAYRFLAEIPLPTPNVGDALNMVTGGFVQMIDNTVPFVVWQATGTAAVTVSGSFVVTQG